MVSACSDANIHLYSDTYTEDELIRGSTLCLQSSGSSKSQVHLGARDRAMLLISTCTAYRGNNTRGLLVSDLAVRDVPMVDIGSDVKVMVSVSHLGYLTYIYLLGSHLGPCFCLRPGKDQHHGPD